VDQARSAAIEAQQLAYGTEQAGERAAVQTVVDALAEVREPRPESPAPAA
jgi:hypothetical protein